MIADYKFYHGVVLAQLVDKMAGPLSIDELVEDGRLCSYILDDKVGLLIKHSSNRLPPWGFTLSIPNLLDLLSLRQRLESVFVVFVCHKVGMVTVTLDEVAAMITPGESEQAWLRINRRPGQWYEVSGGAGELPKRKPRGVAPIIQALSANR